MPEHPVAVLMEMLINNEKLRLSFHRNVLKRLQEHILRHLVHRPGFPDSGHYLNTRPE
jgi:hypothetical protein